MEKLVQTGSSDEESHLFERSVHRLKMLLLSHAFRQLRRLTGLCFYNSETVLACDSHEPILTLTALLSTTQLWCAAVHLIKDYSSSQLAQTNRVEHYGDTRHGTARDYPISNSQYSK